LRVTVAAVGRLRAGPMRALVEEYGRRLPWALTVREVEARRVPAAGAARAAEGALLLGALPERATVVALDGRGQAWDSARLAARIGAWRDAGVRDLAFVIGGADGLDAAVIDRADAVLSLGPMTWPHLLVRVMLAEQLWRAASILDGHPYHRS
jgi:23S rRNA (pseudouridine1915-N3)-methyltransferase